jgi:putative ABC transport system permease protein
VRTRSSASGELAAIAAALQGTSDDLPYVNVRPLIALADRQARSWLLGATAFSLFGGLAVALAAIGIFGALAFSVRQRTLEIGVRMALGAERGDIAGLILRYGAFVLILGGALGAAGAFAASRFVRSLLFNVVPGDPPAFVLALGVLAVAVLAGCLIPLFRATRIDPAVALRYE